MLMCVNIRNLLYKSDDSMSRLGYGLSSAIRMNYLDVPTVLPLGSVMGVGAVSVRLVRLSCIVLHLQ